MIYTIIQIIFAILLVFMLLFAANMIYNYESVVNFRNAYTVKKEIIIFDGIFDYSNTVWTFNTYDKNSLSYKDLSPSINQQGGAEYSYNFWLYIDKGKLNLTKDAVLFLRGSKQLIPYISNTNCEIVRQGKYILVKNPMIRLKDDGSALVIEYNTLTNPDAYRENGVNTIDCSGTWHDKNRGTLGIHTMDDNVYNKKWFMFTLILKEINPEDDILYKNKTSCKIYINGINILDRVVESPYDGSYGSAAMKHNRGPLYINPGDIITANIPATNQVSEKQTLLMANMSYYNYSLSEAEIVDLFKKKFKKAPAVMPLNEEENVVDDMYAISSISEQSNNLPVAF